MEIGSTISGTKIEGGRAGCRGGAPPMEVASLFYTKISHIRVSEIHILYGNWGKGGWGRLEEFWMEIGGDPVETHSVKNHSGLFHTKITRIM